MPSESKVIEVACEELRSIYMAFGTWFFQKYKRSQIIADTRASMFLVRFANQMASI
jgi:hypothetical protein